MHIFSLFRIRIMFQFTSYLFMIRGRGIRVPGVLLGYFKIRLCYLYALYITRLKDSLDAQLYGVKVDVFNSYHYSFRTYASKVIMYQGCGLIFIMSLLNYSYKTRVGSRVVKMLKHYAKHKMIIRLYN